MAIYFIKKIRNGKYQFSLKENEKILLKSRTYLSKTACTNAVQLVRDNAEHFNRYTITNLLNGQCAFGLHNEHGNLIALYTICKSMPILNKRLNLLIQLARNATIVDCTA